MALYAEATLKDINGDISIVGAYCVDRPACITFFQTLKAATNAAILAANIDTPVPLQTIANNDAVAANNESARTKAKIRMRGADLGSVADPFAFVTVSVPAPIGTLINGLSGDPTNADVQSLVGKVLSPSGVTMSTVDKIYYGR